MQEIFLIRDINSGLIKVKILPENKLLEEFFETEIQDDLALTDYLMSKDAGRNGNDYEITGNAFSLTLTADRYIISPLYEDKRAPQEGPSVDFFTLLSRWRHFLKNENSET